MVFGTIIKKWGRRWEIQFQNDRELRLMSREFKVVSNDSNQKQLNVNSRNEISLVTPIEKHIATCTNSGKQINGINLEEEIAEENVE